MKQFDNYELTTLDYTLKYYLEHNEMLDDDDIEWCSIVRKRLTRLFYHKHNTIWSVVRTILLLSHTI